MNQNNRHHAYYKLTLLLMLAFFMWVFVMVYWYSCTNFSQCLFSDQNTSESSILPTYTFKFGQGQLFNPNNLSLPPIDTESLDIDEDQQLVITGLYQNDESKSVGQARAEAIKKLVTRPAVIQSQQVPSGTLYASQDSYAAAYTISVQDTIRETPVEEAVSADQATAVSSEALMNFKVDKLDDGLSLTIEERSALKEIVDTHLQLKHSLLIVNASINDKQGDYQKDLSAQLQSLGASLPNIVFFDRSHLSDSADTEAKYFSSLYLVK